MKLRHRVTAVAGSVSLLGLFVGCDSPAPGPAVPGTCTYTASGQPAKPAEPPKTSGVATTGTSTVVVKMTEGNVRITLDRSAAPCTVNSFESLARQGYFDTTRCHRLTVKVIAVLQCGDPTGSGAGGPGYAFASETHGNETYTPGVVAMANAGPDTNGSQFFLVWGDSTQLDRSPNYTIFGRMDAASIKVVNRIAAEGQDNSNGDGDGHPNSPAQIVSVTRI